MYSSVEALKYKFYVGENQVIYIKDIEPLKQTRDFNMLYQTEYISAIKVGNEGDLIKIVSEIFKQLSDNCESIDTIKRVCLELIVYTSKSVYEVGQDPEIVFKNTDLWSVITRCSTVEDLKKLIININSVVISQIFNNRNSKNQNMIEKAKTLIREKCCDGITLESIAEDLLLSPCYLSFLFHKELNITFKDYLIQEKVNKAKELLTSPQYKIYEVANMVGYSDARYFSEIFKRKTGMTPAQFRE